MGVLTQLEDLASVIKDLRRRLYALEAGPGVYAAGVDVTASRALNTSYTNGNSRRMVRATVTCAATVANGATVGPLTVVGNTAINQSNWAGAPAGYAQSAQVNLSFEVDPKAVYGVNSAVGGSATVTLVHWVEIDS